MNGYYLAMLYICICAGIFVMGQVGAFGDVWNETFSSQIFNYFTGVGIEGMILGGVGIASTIVLVAVAMRVANVQVLNSSAGGSQGVALVLFAGVFWGSFGAAFDVMRGISTRVPGLTIINAVFFALSALVFIMALIQLSTSGVKSHG